MLGKSPTSRFAALNPLRWIYVKFALLLCFLLYILAAVLFATFAYHWRSITDISRQAQHRQLAAQLVQRFSQALLPELDYGSLQREAFAFSELHPEMGVYLLEADGKIVFDLGFYRPAVVEKLDLGAIKAFLAKDSLSAFPLYHANPIRPRDEIVFSAAPLRFAGREGYLYITLGGPGEKIPFIRAVEGAAMSSAALSGIICTVLVFLLGLALFFLVTKRFFRLTDIVRQFESGDFSHRLTITSRDEIGQLGRAVNSMADRIVESLDELKTRDRLRRELVANVSHDLRGPVGVLRGATDMLSGMSRSALADGANRYIDILRRTIDSLSRLLEELFHLAKLEAKEVQPTLRPFALKTLVENTLDNQDQLARDLGVDLEDELPADLPPAIGDSDMIERLLVNLVQNALRHCDAGGKVVVRAAMRESRVRLEVLDTGPGVADGDIQDLTKPFFQAASSPRVGAAGLGLAIVQKILEAHGSRIDITNREQGGACFGFELAAAQPPEAVVCESQSTAVNRSE